MSKRFMTRNY